MIADKWNLSREQMEAFALESHTRALRAIEEGRFDREVVPLEGVERDETPRNTSMEKMAELEPLAEEAIRLSRTGKDATSPASPVASSLKMVAQQDVRISGLKSEK